MFLTSALGWMAVPMSSSRLGESSETGSCCWGSIWQMCQAKAWLILHSARLGKASIEKNFWLQASQTPARGGCERFTIRSLRFDM
jgi:hypothetical protein